MHFSSDKQAWIVVWFWLAWCLQFECEMLCVSLTIATDLLINVVKDTEPSSSEVL